jgi:hypothetical protein
MVLNLTITLSSISATTGNFNQIIDWVPIMYVHSKPLEHLYSHILSLHTVPPSVHMYETTFQAVERLFCTKYKPMYTVQRVSTYEHNENELNRSKL